MALIDDYSKAVALISQAKRLIVFSGAGMSADSGIETFRGSGGTWSGILGALMLIYGGTPFGWYLTPGFVWSQFIKNFYSPIANATPHPGYIALARIGNEFFDGQMHVITMNVDGLHQASGTDPDYVHEVHGTIRRFRCGKCNVSMNEAVGAEPTPTPVLCTVCNSGYARPDVTLFTENLPTADWGKASNAVNRLRRGDVMLVIGTSSVVYPAAGLPERAKEKGAALIEINPSDSTPLSKLMDIHLKAGAADALTKLFELLEASK